ncbi:alpha/beta hydrolase [Chloroflexia bacterium SDU3-3]|nr:alpha/beta hydrolase [Chloroflexia bacterium SDU3-3]
MAELRQPWPIIAHENARLASYTGRREQEKARMPSTTYAGHTITWAEHSQGAQTIILIHGYSDSQLGWGAMLDQLDQLGRCVTLDLPGHGRATAPQGYRTLAQADMLAMMGQAVAQIADGTPITLVGHSTGGLVALGVAATQRQLPIARLVLIDSVVWGPLTGLLGAAQWLLGHGGYWLFWLMWRFTQLHPATLMAGVASYTPRWWALWRNPTAWRLCRESYPWYRHQPLRNLAALLRFLETCDVRPLVPALDIPMLVITGGADPVVPPAQARWLAEHAPNARLAVFPGAGHLPHVEDLAGCVALITPWLAEAA